VRVHLNVKERIATWPRNRSSWAASPPLSCCCRPHPPWHQRSLLSKQWKPILVAVWLWNGWRGGLGAVTGSCGGYVEHWSKVPGRWAERWSSFSLVTGRRRCVSWLDNVMLDVLQLMWYLNTEHTVTVQNSPASRIRADTESLSCMLSLYNYKHEGCASVRK